MLAACGELALTDPNQRTTDTFWTNQADAVTAFVSLFWAGALAGVSFLGQEEIEEIIEEGGTEVACQFCGRKYQFGVEDLPQNRKRVALVEHTESALPMVDVARVTGEQASGALLPHNAQRKSEPSTRSVPPAPLTRA